jgi:hypothetical protein
MIGQEQIDALFVEFCKETSRRYGVRLGQIEFLPPSINPVSFGGRGHIGMSGICWANRWSCGRFFYADTGEPIAM